ncbi:hypothetical protein FB446DRAFT_788457 [Lentinula raphanica]|nr:hypothetical protein FB446DRAFT_788457 [Lentinula raphanica]
MASAVTSSSSFQKTLTSLETSSASGDAHSPTASLGSHSVAGGTGTNSKQVDGMIGGIVGGICLVFLGGLMMLLRWHRRKQASLAQQFNRDMMVKARSNFSLRSWGSR